VCQGGDSAVGLAAYMGRDETLAELIRLKGDVVGNATVVRWSRATAVRTHCW
jgi:hypothetical protein